MNLFSLYLRLKDLWSSGHFDSPEIVELSAAINRLASSLWVSQPALHLVSEFSIVNPEHLQPGVSLRSPLPDTWTACRGTDNHKPEPMPIEYMLLKDQPVPLSKCPMCDAQPFIPFLRGTVQRSKRRWWIFQPQAYCALICSSCKEIVGYESPAPLTYPL